MQVQLLIEETKEWTRKCDPCHFTFFPLIDNKFFPFLATDFYPFYLSQIIQKFKSRYTNHVGIPLAAYVSLNNSDILVAKLCFAAGETPCFPTIDSNTASDNCLFLITTLPFSGNKQSFEKPICGQKRKKEPTKRIQIHSWFQFNFPCTHKQIYTCKYTCISTYIIPKFALLYMINNKEQQMQ